MELEEAKEQLMKWLGQCKYAHYKEEDCIFIDKQYNRVRMKLYTNDHSYGISAKPPTIHDIGYLGCIASSRKPRAGEAWTRGNVLADGPFCYETWAKILGDIVGYELVKIHRPLIYRYKPDLEDTPVHEEGSELESDSEGDDSFKVQKLK